MAKRITDITTEDDQNNFSTRYLETDHATDGTEKITLSGIHNKIENAQTGTTYTLALTDASKLVTIENASAITLTVPTDATVAFPVGTEVYVSQLGAGQITISGTPTLRSLGGNLASSGQYAMIKGIKIDTNEWLFSGDLTT